MTIGASRIPGTKEIKITLYQAKVEGHEGPVQAECVENYGHMKSVAEQLTRAIDEIEAEA